MRITFKENCDVCYEITQFHYELRNFSHIVDWPIDKIELLDDSDSISPTYMSKMEDGKTLIEIKGSPNEINFKYVKKEYLKKEINSDGETIMKYRENIQIDLAENQKLFFLNVHSSHSYISAIKKLSTAKFNNQLFTEPRDLTSITLEQSGTMEIDWTLKIIDVTKEINEDKKRNYLNDYTQKPSKPIYKIDSSYDNSREYEWLDEINEQIIREKPIRDEDIFFHYRIEDILHNRIKDIVKGSCFYLSAGGDITPIIALQDKIRTFIFCDESNSIEDYWSRIENRLQEQNFKKIKISILDKTRFKLESFHRRNMIYRLEKTQMSLWQNNNKLYCLIYLNWDNSMAFHRLYVENGIIPKAICELFPAGGSIGEHARITIPYKFRMPEYSIGHNYSLGKPEEYELISNNLEYGMGGYTNLFKRK